MKMLIAKKSTIIFVVLLIGMMLTAAKCSEDVTKYAYQTLNASQAAYNFAKSVTIDLYKSGYLNDEQKAEAIKLSKAYSDSYHAAVAALKTYETTRGDIDRGGLETALANAGKTLADLTKYLQPYIKKREGG